MASTNQSPFYQRAEQEFHKATTDEKRIACLEIMIKECPKHKSSENMLKNLTNRLKKLKEKSSRQKKSGKSSQKGIKKSEMQSILVGFPNTGKSSIFNILTGLNSKISQYPYTTNHPRMGNFNFENSQIQIIDCPSFPHHNKSLINSTDTLLLIVDSINQIKEADKFIYQTNAKKILIFNKEDLLNNDEKRKITATLQSKFKEFPSILISSKNPGNKKEELKKIIFETFPIIRVYTKEPKKEPSKRPMILSPNSTIGSAAEKILKGMSKKIKRARIWGPSSKFSGQTVGLDHKLKDRDILEFQTT